MSEMENSLSSADEAVGSTPSPREAIAALGLVSLDLDNPYDMDFSGAVESVRMSLTDHLQAEGIDLSGDSLLYLSRGSNKVRWFPDPATGRMMQKDEYAENVPQAMIALCEQLGWTAIILYVGREPEFDESKPSFTELHPDTVVEIDYRAMGTQIGKFRFATTEFAQDAWQDARSDPDWQALFSYKGLSYHDQLDRQMGNFVPTLTSTFISEYARWTAVFDVLRPNAIIGGRLDNNSAACMAADRAGIVSANIKLGIGEEMTALMYQRDRGGSFDERFMPDLQLIWGERQEAMLERRFGDAHPSRFIPVGRTRNDSFVGQNLAGERGVLKRHLGLGPDADIMVFGANHRSFFARDAGERDGICCYSWASYSQTLRAMEAVAEARDHTHVVVKPHPSDDIPKIEALVESLGPRVHLVTNAAGLHNSEILADSALFVSSVTSMFSEALVSGCLPVSLWLDDVNFLYEEGRRDVFDAMAVTVLSIAEMSETLGRYLDDPAARAAEAKELRSGLVEYFGAVDGHNAERSVRAVLHVLGESDPDIAKQVAQLPPIGHSGAN